MNVVTIFAVLLLSLAFTLLFTVGMKSKGPWGSAWTFFVIVGLSLAAVSLWIPPAGPLWLGTPWIDLVLTGMLVSFVLSATSISVNPAEEDALSHSALQGSQHSSDEHVSIHAIHRDHHKRAFVRTGSFFWMLLLCLCALIVIGAI